MKDWEKELLKRAQEIWHYGEGELNLRVRVNPNNKKKEWIISGGRINRGFDKQAYYTEILKEA